MILALVLAVCTSFTTPDGVLHVRCKGSESRGVATIEEAVEAESEAVQRAYASRGVVGGPWWDENRGADGMIAHWLVSTPMGERDIRVSVRFWKTAAGWQTGPREETEP